jgi:hypothetical protein
MKGRAITFDQCHVNELGIIVQQRQQGSDFEVVNRSSLEAMSFPSEQTCCQPKSIRRRMAESERNASELLLSCCFFECMSC